jgi:hypothetical protein
MRGAELPTSCFHGGTRTGSYWHRAGGKERLHGVDAGGPVGQAGNIRRGGQSTRSEE